MEEKKLIKTEFPCVFIIIFCENCPTGFVKTEKHTIIYEHAFKNEMEFV